MNKITTLLATVAAFAATGCSSSYEIDMPSNPTEPVVGSEVSTNVIYQANPRFFGENDCLKGLNSQISRISNMGCDVLWIMPVFEPGELNAIGSPYCVRDFKTLNPRYGSMADLKEVVATAHANGMKVIFDWIANHTAWDCSWITEHSDWYVKDASGNIAATESWPDVAQLDYSNADMRAAMKDAMLYWVDQLAIDGFRCDYADGVPHDFWADLITALRAKNPDMIMLAESADTSLYEDGFDMIYDWEGATTISSAFKSGKASEIVKEAKEAIAKAPESKSILRYAFNHDVAADNNVATMFGTSEGVKAAYVLASMFNGTPMIYSSMDVEGMTGKLSFFDYKSLDFSTTLSDEYKAINIAFKESAELRRGELRDYSKSSVVCFTRSIPGHKLLVAVNISGETQTVKAPIELAGSTMTDMLTGSESEVPVVIELEPYGYTIRKN